MKKKVILSMFLAAVVLVIGLTFQYVVEANADSSGNVLLAISNETTETVTTGVKGYYYIVDEDSNNSDFDVTGATFMEGSVNLDLSNNGKYIHVKAVDVAGNLSDPAVAKIEILSKVSFVLDGGTLDGNPSPAPRVGLAGSTIDIGTPEKDGYVFLGWEPVSGTVDGTDYTFAVAEDTVTAKWEIGNFDYRVEYYYDNLIDNDKTETGTAEFNSFINDYIAKPVDGYKLNKVDKIPLKITSYTEGNVIKVYYVTDNGQTKDLSYTVEYYKEGEKSDADTQIENATVQLLQPDTLPVDSSKINTVNKYFGYKLSEITVNDTVVDTLPETVNDNDVIKVYYVIDEDQTKDLHYTVEYYKDGVKVNTDTQVETQTVQVLQPDTLTVDETKINTVDKYVGYVLDIIDPTEIPETIDDGGVIKVYYKRRTDLTYKVNYLEKDTDEVIHDQKVVTGVTFETVINANSEVITIDGYDYDSSDKPMITIGVEENVINLYYTKRTDLRYKVNYLEKDTNDVLHDPKTVNNVTFGDVITSADEVIDINGYNFDSADNETITIGTGTNVINLYYTKRTDLTYKIKYLEKDTNKVLHDEKEVTGVTFGTVVKAVDEAIEINGYNYAYPDKAQMVIGTEENVMIIYYEKVDGLSYKVNFLEKDTDKVLHSPNVQGNQVFENVIKTEDEIIEIDGYNYDSADKEELVIGTGENVINIYYTKRTDLSYKVNYLEKDTNKVLHDQKVVNNLTFEDEITASDEIITIDGYNYDSISTNKLIIGTGENVINIYYTKRNDLTYKVNYLEKDTETVLHDQKVVTGVTFEDVINANDEIIDIDGYDYNSKDKETLTITTGENVINIYYTKRSDLNYKVNYLEKNTNKVLSKQKVVNDVVFGDVITSSTEVITIDGYNYDSVDKETLTIATGENVINIYYTKRNDLTYKVNYLEKDTNEVLHDQKVVNNMTFEDVITSANEIISIDGYNYDSLDPEKLTITTGENVINIYYTKQDTLRYKVNYLEKDTENVLHKQKVLGGQVFGTVITSNDEVIDIDGYKFDSADKETITIGTGENVINLYYTKRDDLSYTVNYIEKGTGTVLHDPKVVENQVFESIIKSVDEIIEIDGYNYDSADKEILVIKTSDNVINLYYTKKNNLSYTVNYLEKDTGRVLHDPKVVNNVKFETEITSADEVISINGFNFDSADKETLIVGTGENVINLYYTKRNDLTYKVNYLEKNTGRVLHDQKVVNNMTFEDVITSADEVITIDGFNYDSCDKETLIIGTGENVINIYYTKRNDLTYKVNYLEKDTNKVIHDQKVVNNVTFEQVINSSSEIISINGYNYNSVDKETLVIGTGENVINIYYTKRNDLTYRVNYLEKDTNVVLEPQKVVNGVTFEQVINSTSEVITINGYTYDSVDKETLVIGTGENVINIYYTKVEGLSYTVKYLEKDTDKVLHAPKTVGNQVFEDVILAKDEVIDINGYNYDSVSKDKLVIGTDTNEIIIYYTKRNDLSYTVKYVDKETNEEIHDMKVVKNQVFETEILSKDEVIAIDGYYYDSVDKEKLIIGTDKNEITIYYTKRNDLSYTVNYLEKGTNKVLHEPKTVENQKFKDVITSSNEIIDIYGYTYDSVDKEKLIITTGENVINIYYTTKGTRVTVHYYEEGTTNKVANDVVIGGQVFDKYVTEEAKNIDSKYELVAEPVNKTGEMTEDEIVVIYYYRKKPTQVIVHYYEEGTNNKLSENVIIDGRVDDKYTTKPADDIPSKYELIGIPGNATGIMSEDTIEVTYYYRVKDTYLNIKYLEKDTNEELARPEKQTGKVAEDYITGPKTIPGYTLVADSGNTTGKLTEEPITVIFYYLQNTSVEVNHIDKNTGKILDTHTEPGLVGDKYTSNSKNFDGYVLVERPSKETVTMGKDKIVLNYYYVHVSAGVIEKHIDDVTGEILYNAAHTGNEGDPYNIPSKTFNGYDLVEEKLPTNSKGTMTIDPIEVVYYYKYRTKVTAEYIDRETGKKLTKDEVQTGHEKDPYTTERKEFKDYVLVEIPENADGEMTKEPIVATYYYAHISAGVTVKHIDNITGEVLSESRIEGNEGDPYETEPISIPGYDLVKEKLPDNASGEMKIKETVVNYYYVKQSSVTIKYIDRETGKEIIPSDEIKGHHGDKYETKDKEIDGYELIEVPANKEGTMGADPTEVVYIYAKPAKVIVNYIDVDTNKPITDSTEIPGHEGDEYETEPKDIKYYELVEEKLPKNDKGEMDAGDTEVNYYYRKLKFSLKVDKTIENVTLNGNVLPINGDLGKVEIYRKNVANASLQIRYKITVTNDGELTGKATLLEKIPSGTTMSKANNPLWDITSTSATLVTEDIKPGETKEYIVILDWVNSEANIGTKTNNVDVLSTENEAGFDTPDADFKGDSAELIITVSTGSETYVIATSVMLVVLAGLSVVLVKKAKKEEK